MNTDKPHTPAPIPPVAGVLSFDSAKYLEHV